MQRSGGLWFKVSPRQIVHETLSGKFSTQKRGGGVAQVVECLPRKYKTLRIKKKKKRNSTHFTRFEIIK
jgi:hypothetical protein